MIGLYFLSIHLIFVYFALSAVFVIYENKSTLACNVLAAFGICGGGRGLRLVEGTQHDYNK